MLLLYSLTLGQGQGKYKKTHKNMSFFLLLLVEDMTSLGHF